MPLPPLPLPPFPLPGSTLLPPLAPPAAGVVLLPPLLLLLPHSLLPLRPSPGAACAGALPLLAAAVVLASRSCTLDASVEDATAAAVGLSADVRAARCGARIIRLRNGHSAITCASSGGKVKIHCADAPRCNLDEAPSYHYCVAVTDGCTTLGVSRKSGLPRLADSMLHSNLTTG